MVLSTFLKKNYINNGSIIFAFLNKTFYKKKSLNTKTKGSFGIVFVSISLLFCFCCVLFYCQFFKNKKHVLIQVLFHIVFVFFIFCLCFGFFFPCFCFVANFLKTKTCLDTLNVVYYKKLKTKNTFI